MKDLDRLLSPNYSFKARNVDIGVVKLSEPWPVADGSGSGAAWDFGKRSPTIAMNFDV